MTLTSTEAAVQLAETVENDVLMPFSYWEINGVFIVVHQGDSAEAFRRICVGQQLQHPAPMRDA